MRERIGRSPWLSALASWVIVTGTATLGLFVWHQVRNTPFLWEDVRFLAMVAGGLALLNAWRDSRR